MNNNILDQAERYSGPRTCPECGHQFPFVAFVKRTLMSFGLSKWPCQGCREVIKCDFIKLQFLWLLGLVLTGVIFAVLLPYVEIGMLNLFYMMANFAFIFWTSYHVKFKKLE